MEFEDAILFVADHFTPALENMNSLFEQPDKTVFRFDCEKATASSSGFDKVVRSLLEAIFGT